MPFLFREMWLMNPDLFIFFRVEENGTKRRRPCPEPCGCACASRPWPDAPKLGRLRRTQTVVASLSAKVSMRRPRDKGEN